jgi:hypothetical protein
MADERQHSGRAQQHPLDNTDANTNTTSNNNDGDQSQRAQIGLGARRCATQRHGQQGGAERDGAWKRQKYSNGLVKTTR